MKWTETRSEDMAGLHHGRDQIDYVRMGAKSDGTITALHIEVLADLGAYFQLLTPFIPAFTAFVASGCYKIPAVQTDVTGVFTNKFPTDAIRGAGRPEATHLIEVMMDQVADELGMDRLELRRKNFIPKEDFPAEVAIGIVYDSGDYAGALDKLLEHIDPTRFRREQEELREQGHLPRHRVLDLHGDLRPRAVARGRPERRRPPGRRSGSPRRCACTRRARRPSTPAPRRTARASTRRSRQIVADRLGIAPAAGGGHPRRHRPRARSAWAPTARARWRSAASRSRVRPRRWPTRRRRSRAHLLEAAPEDIELADGKFQVQGLARQGRCRWPRSRARPTSPEDMPEDMEPGLEEISFYDPENFVFPFGAHACVVDVDAETGKVEVVRYVAVDDCGPAINPMLIDGQVHGGIAHAIGQALYEQVVYDEDGQLVTGTFVDYALPTAAELPRFETDRTETPSPVNTLGVKGIGEAGTIAASPAVVNAVIDALRPLGVDVPRHAADADARVAGDRGAGRRRRPAATEQGVDPSAGSPAPDRAHPKEVQHDSRRSTTVPGRSTRPSGARRGRRGRQAARRRPLADPADEAAAGGADAAHRPAQGRRAAQASQRVQRHARDRRRDDPCDARRDRAGARGRRAVAAGTIADQQVRNRGTIGGSLAHGDPASDLPAVLLALEGDARRAQGPGGEREIAAADLFQDYLTTSLAPTR